MIDYHLFTIFYFPTGVVDSLIHFYFYWYDNQTLFDRKSLKFFTSTHRNKSTSAEDEL